MRQQGQTEMSELTHFSESGRARMVDVSQKADSQRVAVASGVLRLPAQPRVAGCAA